jgi:hypothetical protein
VFFSLPCSNTLSLCEKEEEEEEAAACSIMKIEADVQTHCMIAEGKGLWRIVIHCIGVFTYR